MFVQSHVQRVQSHNHHNERQRQASALAKTWPGHLPPTGLIRPAISLRPIKSSNCHLIGRGKLLKFWPNSRHANRTSSSSFSTLIPKKHSLGATSSGPIKSLRVSARSRKPLKRLKCFSNPFGCSLISNLNWIHLIIEHLNCINQRDKKSSAIDQAQGSGRLATNISKLNLFPSSFNTFWAWTIQEIFKQILLFIVLLSSKIIPFQWQLVLQNQNNLFSASISTIANYCRGHLALNGKLNERAESEMRPSVNLSGIKFAPGEFSRHNSLDENHSQPEAANGNQSDCRNQHQRCLMTSALNSMLVPCELHCQQRATSAARLPHAAHLLPAELEHLDQINRVYDQHQPRSYALIESPSQSEAFAHLTIPIQSAPSRLALEFVPMPQTGRHLQGPTTSSCRHHFHQQPALTSLASNSSIQPNWHNQGQHYNLINPFKEQLVPERANLVTDLSQQSSSVSSPVLFASSDQFKRQQSAQFDHHQTKASKHSLAANDLHENRFWETFQPILDNTKPKLIDSCNKLAAAPPTSGPCALHKHVNAENKFPQCYQHFRPTQTAPLFGPRANTCSNQKQCNFDNCVKSNQRKLSSIISSDSELCCQNAQLKAQTSTCLAESFSSTSISSSACSSNELDHDHQTQLANSEAINNREQKLTSFAVKFPQVPPARRLVHPLDGLRLHHQSSSSTSEASCSTQLGNLRLRSSQQVVVAAAASDFSGKWQPQQTQTKADCRNWPPELASKEVVEKELTIKRADDKQQVGNATPEVDITGQEDESASHNERVTGGRSSVKLAASGKSRSLMQSPIGMAAAAATLGKVSLAGAKRRLGFKQNRGLNSLSVHRSEEIFPLELNNSNNCYNHNQFNQSTNTNTTTNFRCGQNGSSPELGHNHQVCSTTTTTTTRQFNGKWLDRFSSELCDPNVCFVEGLGLGQVVSRQALVSPYLGDIQLSLSDRRGMLEVEVIRVRQLHARAQAKRPPAFYVKVYLMRDKKCLAKVKTSLISHTLNPLFQQLFTFRENYSNCVLQIIVWANYGKNDRKSLTGSVQIHLNELDISNVIIGWYRLFNAPSMVANQSIGASRASQDR